MELLHATTQSLGGRMFVALWGGLVVVGLACPIGGDVVAGTLVLALVAGCGVGQKPVSAAAIAATGWLVINGFVQHRYGELGFGASSWLLLVLVLGVVLLVAERTARTATQR